MAKPLEREVLKSCLGWLNEQNGIWAWRRNVGAMEVKQPGGVPRWVRYGQKGQADIEGIIMLDWKGEIIGIHLEVEVKREGNTPTSEQRAWLAATSSYGGVSLWADSASTLEAKLRQVFTRRKWPWPGTRTG